MSPSPENNLARAAAEANNNGLWAFLSALVGGGGFLATWALKKKSKPFGKSLHDVIFELSDDVKVLRINQEVRAIQQARIEERMATKDDLNNLERVFTGIVLKQSQANARREL